MSVCSDQLLSQLTEITLAQNISLQAILDALLLQNDKLNDQAVKIGESCFKTDAADPEVLITIITIVDGEVKSTLYTYADGTPYTGSTPIATDPCDCPCKPCGTVIIDPPEVKACALLDFADMFSIQQFREEGGQGGFIGWQVEMGATSSSGDQANAISDFLNPGNAVNKSEWYAAFVAGVHAMAEWDMVLVTDVAVGLEGKPQYKLSFTGTGTGSIKFKYAKPDGTVDLYSMQVSAAGVVITDTDDGSGAPFGTSPWHAC